ncbi:hypothetical protein MNBD_GAMMA08-2900 [hydrothermal vent metagenome]|uniref:Uncharacterized protein n=1 Tax=hydrothermal vent metagenome TaxID=652676 RepID=A0A3B0XSI0_9ZZZZ
MEVLSISNRKKQVKNHPLSELSPKLSSKLLTGRAQRSRIIEKRQPHGCGCRVYRGDFTVTSG